LDVDLGDGNIIDAGKAAFHKFGIASQTGDILVTVVMVCCADEQEVAAMNECATVPGQKFEYGVRAFYFRVQVTLMI
jgi:hypothetical protein